MEIRPSIRQLSVVLLLFACVACTATARPPQGPFEEPVAVFLVVDSRHAGLVMPDVEGGYVEYGYGEWKWYAESEDAWYRVFPAMLWPTRGTLGRRFARVEDEADLRARWWWLELQRFEVERPRMAALRDRLDGDFAARSAELLHNPDYRMDFVPSAAGYWCFFNCNDALTDWLEALGCEVSWLPMRLGVELRAEVLE